MIMVQGWCLTQKVHEPPGLVRTKIQEPSLISTSPTLYVKLPLLYPPVEVCHNLQYIQNIDMKKVAFSYILNELSSDTKFKAV